MVAETFDEGEETSSSKEKSEGSENQPDPNLPEVSSEPAGLTVQGSWKEIKAFCACFSYTLRKVTAEEGISDEELKSWEKWFPTDKEDQDTVKEKSASQASFEPDRSPKKELDISADRLDQTQQSFEEGEYKEGIQQISSATTHLLGGLFTLLGKELGNLEGFIYRKIITKTNAAYFDSSLLSANLEEKSPSGSNEKSYKIQIKIHDEDLRKRMIDRLPQ